PTAGLLRAGTPAQRRAALTAQSAPAAPHRCLGAVPPAATPVTEGAQAGRAPEKRPAAAVRISAAGCLTGTKKGARRLPFVAPVPLFQAFCALLQFGISLHASGDFVIGRDIQIGVLYRFNHFFLGF